MKFPVILYSHSQPEYAVANINLNQASLLRTTFLKNKIAFYIICDINKIESVFYNYSEDIFIFGTAQYMNTNTFRDFFKVILQKDYKNG